MNITLKELMTGKATMIKNKSYFETKKYVQPFIDRMSEFTDKFVISVKMPDQMTIADNNADVTFNRVHIQAILPKIKGDYHEVIGFCYALDVRKPVAKFYRAYKNLNTGVLVAFNPMWQFSQAIEQEEPISYAGIKKLMELTDDVDLKLEELSNKSIDKKTINSILGNWVIGCLNQESYSEFGKVKLSVSNAVDAYKLLFDDSESSYYVEEDVIPVHLDCYEAFGQVLADDSKEIINKFDKIMLVNKLFGL